MSADQSRGNQIAVALAGIDGDIALATFIFTAVIGNRRTFAIAVGGSGQYLQIALLGFRGEGNQANNLAIGRQAHTAHTAVNTIARP